MDLLCVETYVILIYILGIYETRDSQHSLPQRDNLG